MRALRILTCSSLLVATAQAQSNLYTINGSAAGDRFGSAVAMAGDVNGDRYMDVIVGAPAASTNGTASGSVRVFSGLDGSTLYTRSGSRPEDQFGLAVAGAGDANGDGFDDFAVGSPRDDTSNGVDSGSVRLYSGATGSLLRIIRGSAAGDLFGYSVDGAGDVNADGYDDLIVGAIFDDSGAPDAGRATVVSGRDGSAIYTFDGTTIDQFNGWSVSGAGDCNGDGFSDVIVGSHTDSTNGLFAGAARVYSGIDGALLHTFLGDASGELLGYSVDGGGDVDRDGFDDLVVGASGNDTNGINSGLVRVYSGATGAAMYTFFGDSAFDVMGHSVANAGDLDCDGHADILGGAYGDDGAGVNAGSARAWSGATGNVLFTINGNPGHHLGYAVAGGGDTDYDGFDEILVGAEAASAAGPEAGRAIIVHSPATGTPPKHYYRDSGCASSNGNLPRVLIRGRSAAGETYGVELRGATPGRTGLLNVGIRWDLDLSAIAPGCIAYAYPLLTFAVPVNAFGIARGSIMVPNDLSLLGGRLHNQYLLIDAGASGIGLAGSNAVTVTLGTPTCP